ncbi:hypothetical protein GRJ2_003362200 [Grus japonensis]|uniref:DRBM domain-containing protein n=1 Tax=Grus japonensis TaxID=30415 RepID=A0ABC9YI45_GRUJA
MAPLKCEGKISIQGRSCELPRGKWTTTDEGIQYLRELAVLEVIYSDPEDDEVSKDLEDVLCTRAVWRKRIQSAPVSNSLAAMYCLDMDTPTVEKGSTWLQNFEENLCTSSSLQASALAVRGNHRKWKAAVWSPTRQVVEATEGEGKSSQFAEVKATQLALEIAE